MTDHTAIEAQRPHLGYDIDGVTKRTNEFTGLVGFPVDHTAGLSRTSSLQAAWTAVRDRHQVERTICASRGTTLQYTGDGRQCHRLERDTAQRGIKEFATAKGR
jgi:hypothetical protein